MKNSEQSAFPESATAEGYKANVMSGLTKREYFAGLFTQAIVSSIDCESEYQRLRALAASEGMKVSGWIAHDAIKQADALLLELEKPQP